MRGEGHDVDLSIQPSTCYLLVGLLVSGLACGPSRGRQEIDLTAPGATNVIEPSRSIDAEHLVPMFRVQTVEGDVLDSRELVGTRPFMLVYFATWCQVCQLKLPMIRVALERFAPELAVYGVVMDDADTWHRVPEYLERYELEFELVRAEHFPRFAAAYSPSGLVPAVTIVGKQGYLVDYQHGYSRQHLPRLRQAFAMAEAQR